MNTQGFFLSGGSMTIMQRFLPECFARMTEVSNFDFPMCRHIMQWLKG